MHEQEPTNELSPEARLLIERTQAEFSNDHLGVDEAVTADENLCRFARENPDQGVLMFRALARSESYDDQMTAACYIGSVIESEPDGLLEICEELLSMDIGTTDIPYFALELIESELDQDSYSPAVRARVIDLCARYQHIKG